jgi:ubiquinone/menaquinone biosynthesis C-methylase UbiE
MGDLMPQDKSLNLFFELHHDLPRQAPGDREFTQRAFQMCRDMPRKPKILDVGCGPGQQTLDLLEISDGNIIAVDNHQPYLDELMRRVQQAGVQDRVAPLKKDMQELEFDPETFDLIWAEGSIYILGFQKGLKTWKRFLKPGGYIAVTELTWLQPDTPAELLAFWNEAYPAMQDIDANVDEFHNQGYELKGHFVLPESAWWNNYYYPLQQKMPSFRKSYEDEARAQEIISTEQREIDLYKMYADYYGYVFYVAQRIES